MLDCPYCEKKGFKHQGALNGHIRFKHPEKLQQQEPDKTSTDEPKPQIEQAQSNLVEEDKKIFEALKEHFQTDEATLFHNMLDTFLKAHNLNVKW